MSFGLSSLVVALLAAGATQPLDPPSPAGFDDPFRAPSAAALRLNAEGTALYRKGRWDEARGKFRDALNAEPTYLAPLLNVACSYVRQERFDDAMAAALELLRRGGPVPWTREILEAADLGALLVRPGAMQTLRAAFATAAQEWGQGLDGAVLFVGRLAEPLKLPASGVAVLGPRQEIYAWLPTVRRYRRLTVEDGRVIALARSPDGRRAMYLVADKVVRRDGRSTALRGLALRELTLGVLSAGPALPLSGDVSRLAIAFRQGEFLVSVESTSAPRTFVVRGGRLEPSAQRGRERPLLVLTPAGAEAPSPLRLRGACPTQVRELRRGRRAPVLEARTCGPKAPVLISPPLGGSLCGLPLED